MDKASSRPIQGAARGAPGPDALPLALHAFRIQATDGHARCGLFQTAHGTIRTPVFAPVGTQGTVKHRRAARGSCLHHATAPRPFFATRVKSFSEAPRGRFSPRSHWLTKLVVTLRYRAKTA